MAPLARVDRRVQGWAGSGTGGGKPDSGAGSKSRRPEGGGSRPEQGRPVLGRVAGKRSGAKILASSGQAGIGKKSPQLKSLKLFLVNDFPR